MISTRSASVKTGENSRTGVATDSTSWASLSATSRGRIVDDRKVTASARRTSSAASWAITRRISLAKARSSSDSGASSILRQSLWAAAARSSAVAPRIRV